MITNTSFIELTENAMLTGGFHTWYQGELGFIVEVKDMQPYWLMPGYALRIVTPHGVGWTYSEHVVRCEINPEDGVE